MHKIYEVDFAGRKLTIETGKMAKQAHGACTISYADTVILVTVGRSDEQAKGLDFLPLTVNYQEMTYAAGKIPGGFFKREGRQNEREVLASRLIDRMMRPMFTEGYGRETQLLTTVLSADHESDPSVVAAIGASAVLGISDIPFETPIAAIRVGRIDGELKANPSMEAMKESDIDLLVAGTRDGIVMVEGGAKHASEEDMIAALDFAHTEMMPVLDLQDKIYAESVKENIVAEVEPRDEDLYKKVEDFITDKLKDALTIKTKIERYAQLKVVKKELVEFLGEEAEEETVKKAKSYLDDLKYNVMRKAVLDGVRVDGRNAKEIRNIECEVGVLPRTHGSSLFTRGETQSLVTVTLGTREDEQRIDALTGMHFKSFMLHYNFPPFSVGEVRPMRGPGRREIGHGALAERAVAKILPDSEDFPYTVRIVSEILESNGSSSMATVCGASLALMDAGVKTKAPVAGIAMGLIKEGDNYAILSDILGDEDHLGDMDFKVAGTKEGITALQMDIKVKGLAKKIMEEALHQAKDGRLHIIGEMEKSIDQGRSDMSKYAPKIVTLSIKTDKIKDVIGPGGKIIKAIVADTGAKVSVDDDGTVTIAAVDQNAIDAAVERVKDITAEAEIGKIYEGPVKKIMDFGAFIEILPGKDGLCHISQLAEERVEKVEDVLKEGDVVRVKVLDVDRAGKIKLSMKEAKKDEG